MDSRGSQLRGLLLMQGISNGLLFGGHPVDVGLAVCRCTKPFDPRAESQPIVPGEDREVPLERQRLDAGFCLRYRREHSSCACAVARATNFRAFPARHSAHARPTINHIAIDVFLRRRERTAIAVQTL